MAHPHPHHHHHENSILAASFASFYTDATSSVAANGIIPLSVTQATTSDISINGSGVITVNTPGYYYVDFGASQSSSGEPLLVQVAINGIAVTGATLASDPAPTALLSASSIIYVPEVGTLVTLLNTNTTGLSFPLNLGNGVANTTTAFISLARVRD